VEGRQLEDIARPLTATGRDPEERAPSEDQLRSDSGPRSSRHSSPRSATINRYRPGPGRQSSRVMGYAPSPSVSVESEVAAILQTLDENGPLDRRQIYQILGARFWGPGVLREALRGAVIEGSIVRVPPSKYGISTHDAPNGR